MVRLPSSRPPRAAREPSDAGFAMIPPHVFGRTDRRPDGTEHA
jgi:hypothetical protein